MLSIAAILAVTSGCTTTSLMQTKEAQSKAAPYSEPKLSANESAVVFLRIDTLKKFDLVDVSVDKRHHTSLKPGQYSVLKTCAGKHVVSGAVAGVKPNGHESKGRPVNVKANDIQFVAVTVDPTTRQPVLNAISKKTAAKYLPKVHKQSNTTDDVSQKECPMMASK